MENPTVIVKIGGKAAADSWQVTSLIEEIHLLGGEKRFVLVHGGGKEVSTLAARLGIESVFENGIRMTGTREMDVVDMVLSGLANKRIVRALAAHGVRAVGLSGSDGNLFTGKPVNNSRGEETRTGTLTRVQPEILSCLLSDGYLPVLASTFSDGNGAGLNLNADDAALAVATALHAESLLFLSDIPGIMKDGHVIPFLSPSRVESEISSGVIEGGMIPKVRSSVSALSHGVGTVIIGQYSAEGDLRRFLSGQNGTRITA